MIEPITCFSTQELIMLSTFPQHGAIKVPKDGLDELTLMQLVHREILIVEPSMIDESMVLIAFNWPGGYDQFRSYVTDDIYAEDRAALLPFFEQKRLMLIATINGIQDKNSHEYASTVALLDILVGCVGMLKHTDARKAQA